MCLHYRHIFLHYFAVFVFFLFCFFIALCLLLYSTVSARFINFNEFSFGFNNFADVHLSLHFALLYLRLFYFYCILCALFDSYFDTALAACAASTQTRLCHFALGRHGVYVTHREIYERTYICVCVCIYAVVCMFTALAIAALISHTSAYKQAFVCVCVCLHLYLNFLAVNLTCA